MDPSIGYPRLRDQFPPILVVGAGRMGALHARAMRRARGFRLVGVVDPRRPAWDEPWFGSVESAVRATGAKSAVVAVPPQHHFEVADACLRAGLDVLLEKPICPESERARELSRRFRDRGRTLFGGHSERFHPVFRALLELSRAWGTPRRVRCERIGPVPPAPPAGGALLDLGIHDLDLLSRLFGPPTWLEARAPGRDLVQALGRLPAGGAVELRCGYAATRSRRWTIETSAGTWVAEFAERRLSDPSNGVECPLPPGDPLELEHAAFRRACRAGGDPPDLESQIQAVEQVEAIGSLVR